MSGPAASLWFGALFTEDERDQFAEDGFEFESDDVDVIYGAGGERIGLEYTPLTKSAIGFGDAVAIEPDYLRREERIMLASRAVRAALESLGLDAGRLLGWYLSVVE